MKEYTEAELKCKAETYCSGAERCPSEVEKKLIQWGGTSETIETIMLHLFKERYLDTARYCRFFVRDKYRFNQWGRMKISQALRMKQLSSNDINVAMDEIDDEEYHAILATLLKQKARSIKSATIYERNAKLIRFAVGRGFLMDEILQHIKQVDYDNDAEESVYLD